MKSDRPALSLENEGTEILGVDIVCCRLPSSRFEAGGAELDPGPPVGALSAWLPREGGMGVCGPLQLPRGCALCQAADLDFPPLAASSLEKQQGGGKGTGCPCYTRHRRVKGDRKAPASNSLTPILVNMGDACTPNSTSQSLFLSGCYWERR